MTKSEKSEYDRQRYLTLKKPERFGQRKCRCCEILLKSKYGAYNTRSYCRRCVELGYAKKDLNRRYYKENRKAILKNARLRLTNKSVII